MTDINLDATGINHSVDGLLRDAYEIQCLITEKQNEIAVLTEKKNKIIAQYKHAGVTTEGAYALDTKTKKRRKLNNLRFFREHRAEYQQVAKIVFRSALIDIDPFLLETLKAHGGLEFSSTISDAESILHPREMQDLCEIITTTTTTISKRREQ